MRHRKKGRKLNRTPAHRKAMVRNMVCNLLRVQPQGDEPRRVTTTVPKAKEARRLAERAITLGKRGTLHARRRALALLQSKAVVKTLFEDIAPLYNDRHGGYTRILRLPVSRRGDGADLCYLELVSEPLEEKPVEPVAPKVTAQAPATGAPEAEPEDDAAAEAADTGAGEDEDEGDEEASSRS
ncbi:MAG: 50S ribosomal protein L17 [Planctomycetota bacterium]